MKIADLRKRYHDDLRSHVLRLSRGIPNFADTSSRASSAIATVIVNKMGGAEEASLSAQFIGNRFESLTRDYLAESFLLIQHLRPGRWIFDSKANIAQFEQYKHLAQIQRLLNDNPELTAALGGDYLVRPDIVIGKYPVSDDDINLYETLVSEGDKVSGYTSFRAHNTDQLTLHASISCKWSIRSDRSQNVRTEALNLIRNRKGFSPKIIAVTAEPLPTRIASLALGTGDIDCVYHIALNELLAAVEETDNDVQLDMLGTLVNGDRLRDISDLPFDLAI